MFNPRKINIKIDTITNICKELVLFGTSTDFLKIDVEGFEKDGLL